MNMQKFVKSVLIAGILCFGLVAASYADVTLNLSTSKINNTIAAGNTFELRIGVSDATTLCGAALTVEYDTTILEAVTAAGVALPAGEIAANETDIKSEIFELVTPATGTAEYTRVGNSQTGKVLLSGANIGTTGAGEFTGAKNLFSLFFKVKAGVTEQAYANAFTVKQTSIYNPAAGYGSADDTAHTPVAVPALVGVPDGWATLTDVSQQFTNIGVTLPVVLPITVGVESTVTKGDPTGDGQVTIDDVKVTFTGFLGGALTSDQLSAANICDDGDGNTSVSMNDVKANFTIFLGGTPTCTPAP